MRERSLFYLSFFLMLAGAVAIAAGSILRAYRKKERVYEGDARAKVVDLVLRQDDSGAGPFSNKYFPVFQFYAGGRLCEIVYPRGAYPAAWEIGQSVQIEYDPKNPEKYRIRRGGWKDFLPEFLSGAGIVLMIAGAVVFLRFALRPGAE